MYVLPLIIPATANIRLCNMWLSMQLKKFKVFMNIKQSEFSYKKVKYH
jgi:hypothetical protein